MSDYTEKNSNLIPQIDIPCFAWNSQAEQGFLFFKAKSLVQYEICESIKRGNAIVGIHINNIRDMLTGQVSARCNIHSAIGEYNDGTPAYFDSFCDEIHDYVNENGYSNLNSWVENAARRKGK